MKKIGVTFLLTFCMFCFACTESGQHNQSISVYENENIYRFEAKFPVDKTQKVRAYLNKALKTAVSFKRNPSTQFDLPGNSTFNVELALGFFEMKFDKEHGSHANLLKVKRLADGLNEVL
ncbi:hypothetical protein [Pedobacter sp. MW01-1-1]|uniref:hypothetical protein n=1 Tax=Pedobacter sp. MW01-1-1 TaxID=3383027 RepID=UPI003FEF32C5